MVADTKFCVAEVWVSNHSWCILHSYVYIVLAVMHTNITTEVMKCAAVTCSRASNSEKLPGGGEASAKREAQRLRFLTYFFLSCL